MTTPGACSRARPPRPMGPSPRTTAAAGTSAAMAGVQPPTGPEGGWGNPCLFGSPNDDEGEVMSMVPLADACGQRTCHVKALFQNQQLRFVMTNLEEYAGDADSTRFD